MYNGPVRNHRAFSLVEMMMVVLLLAIAAATATDLISETDAAIRADRTARECQTALLYARSLAVTTGNTCGVRFDTTAKQFWVWKNATPATAVTTNLAAGNGSYVVDLTSSAGVSGVTMSPTIALSASSPFDVQYTSLGATSNTGTVTFSYGKKTRVVTIAAVGDPTLK